MAKSHPKVLIVYTDEIGSSTSQENAKPETVIDSTARHFSAVIEAISVEGADTQIIKNVGDSLIVRFSSEVLLQLLARFADLKFKHRKLRIGIHCAKLEDLVIDDHARELIHKLEERTPQADLQKRWRDYKSHLAIDIFGHDMNLAARIAGLPRGNFLVISQSVYDTLVEQVSREMPGGELWEGQLVRPHNLNKALIGHRFVVSQPFPVVFLKGLAQFDVAHPTYMYEVLSLKDRAQYLHKCVDRGAAKRRPRRPATRTGRQASLDLSPVIPPFPLAVEQKQHRMIYEVSLHLADNITANDVLESARSYYADLKLLPTVVRRKKKLPWTMPHPATAYLDGIFDVYGVCEIDLRRKQAVEATIRDGLEHGHVYKREVGVLVSFVLLASFPEARAEERFRSFLDFTEEESEGRRFSFVRSLTIWHQSVVKVPPDNSRVVARRQDNDRRFGVDFFEDMLTRERALSQPTTHLDHAIVLFRMTPEACRQATSMSATFGEMTPADEDCLGTLISYGLLRGGWDGYMLYRVHQGKSYADFVSTLSAMGENSSSFIHKKIEFCRLLFLRQLVNDSYIATNLGVLNGSRA